MRYYVAKCKTDLLGFLDFEEIRFQSHIKGVSRPTAKKIFEGRRPKSKLPKMSTVLTAVLAHGYGAEIYIGYRGIETEMWQRKGQRPKSKSEIKNVITDIRKALLKRLETIVKDGSKNTGMSIEEYLKYRDIQKDLLYKSSPASIDELMEAIARIGDCTSFYINSPHTDDPVVTQYHSMVD